MKPFSFVHAADLHLGTPFTGLSECSPEWGERLAQASFRAFERIIGLCLDRQVDFLLLAGDIYDTTEHDLRAEVCLRDGLARLAAHGIPTYIATGNHDYKDISGTRLNWPQEVHFFSPGQVSTYSVIKDGIPIADISGVSYPSRNPSQNYVPFFSGEGAAGFKIGVLHTNVGGKAEYANYAPCTLSDLQAAGIDYWALGHVHQAMILSTQNPVVVYPGTCQGRSARETGPKGCYHVEVNQTGIIPTFIPTAEVLWAELELDISAWDQVDSLFTTVDQELARLVHQADYLIVRLTLVGRGVVHADFSGDQDQISEALRARTYQGWRGVWFDQVKVATRPLIAREAERGSGTLTADFLDIIDKLKADVEADVESPLVQGLLSELMPLVTKNRRYLSPFTKQAFLEGLAAAEDLGLDLLTREED